MPGSSARCHCQSFDWHRLIRDSPSPAVHRIVASPDIREELRGSIEWYDKACIKLHRTEGPNLLVLQHNIKYMYKADESDDDGSEALVDE